MIIGLNLMAARKINLKTAILLLLSFSFVLFFTVSAVNAGDKLDVRTASISNESLKRVDNSAQGNGILSNRSLTDDRSDLDSPALNENAILRNIDAESKAKLKRATVVVDAGHGGIDSGTYFEKTYEKDINLNIALKLGSILKEAGIKVIYTRETDEFIALKTRPSIANANKATLFISVHSNALEGVPEYKGTETLYRLEDKSKNSRMDGKRFAQIVQSEMITDLKTDDNGILYRPNLAVLRLTTMPAVIAEVGYLSNTSDRARLTSEEFRQKTAEALAKAVIKTLDEMLP